MATTTIPEVKPQETTKKAPIMLTPNAVAKVKEIMGQQTPVAAAAPASRTRCLSRMPRA